VLFSGATYNFRQGGGGIGDRAFFETGLVTE
jgi:hypothetical protein